MKESRRNFDEMERETKGQKDGIVHHDPTSLLLHVETAIQHCHRHCLMGTIAVKSDLSCRTSSGWDGNLKSSSEPLIQVSATRPPYYSGFAVRIELQSRLPSSQTSANCAPKTLLTEPYDSLEWTVRLVRLFVLIKAAAT